MHSIPSLSLSPLTSAPSVASPPFSITTQFDLIPTHTRTHEPLAAAAVISGLSGRRRRRRLFCNPLIKQLTKSGACTKCAERARRGGGGRCGARLAPPPAAEHGRVASGEMSLRSTTDMSTYRRSPNEVLETPVFYCLSLEEPFHMKWVHQIVEEERM